MRITKRILDNTVKHLNRVTGSPLTSYTKTDDGNYKPNIGNFHIDGAYGGYKLVRIVNDGGGQTDVSAGGYVSKKELHYMIKTTINTLIDLKDEKF